MLVFRVRTFPPRCRADGPCRTAFTLVELLVVIAIIGVLVALLLPAVQQARESGRRAQCVNNQRQVGLAMHMHHDTLKTLPPATPCVNPVWGQGTWQVSVLNYMEMQTIREMYYDYGINGGRNYYHVDNVRGATGKKIVAWLCPSNRRNDNAWPSPNSMSVTYHNYVVNYGNTGIRESTANWHINPPGGGQFLGAPFICDPKGKPMANITD